MAQSKFLLQGLSECDDHYAAVKEVLLLPNISRCLIAIAFANARGIGLMLNELYSLKDKLTLYVGIRNGITSKQALQMLLNKGICPVCVDTATQAYIFHPKVYLAENENSGKLLVGSANFTPGGFVKNIEGSIIMNLDKSSNEDIVLLQSVYDNFSNLYSNNPNNMFVLSDITVLDEMVDQGLLIDETNAIVKAAMQAKSTGVRNEQRKRMILKTRKINSSRNARHHVSEIPTDTTTLSPEYTEIVNQKLLWKSAPLKRRALNIPTGEKTNQTGSMFLNLGDKSQEIDFQHYFRDDVFSSENWVFDTNPSTKHYERAFIKFNIIIKDVNHGIFTLKVSHNTNTASKTYNQHNSVTQIHWGDAKPLIAQEDLLGGIMCIYAPEDGSDTYTLTFDVD